MIRVSPIRLIGPDGEQVGIIPTKEALQRAREAGLDLVEVAPTSRPPVCRIMDFGKYKYDQAKKASVSKKKQHAMGIKGMRFRPKIEEHDYQFKKKHVEEFLLQGNKVKCFVLFRGREKAHKEFGAKILDRMAEDLAEIATVENPPKMEGNSMTMLLSPISTTGKKPQQEEAPQKKSRRRREQRAEKQDEELSSAASPDDDATDEEGSE